MPAKKGKVWKVGVVGFAHMHVLDLMKSFAETGSVEWVACADTVPVRPSLSDQGGTRGSNLRHAVEAYKVPKVYEDHSEMLEAGGLDIVIACPENVRHAEVIEPILAKGIHVLVEKPMAVSYGDALRMQKASANNGAALVVNWPSTWSPTVRAAHEVLSSGRYGRLLKFYYRNGPSMGPFEYGQSLSPREKGAEWWHTRSEGGGAMLDYCCYGACLARWFCGPTAVSAYGMRANLNSPYGDADDYGTMAVRFAESVAVLEGSWVTYNNGFPNGPILYTDKATIVTMGWGEGEVLVYGDKYGEPTARVKAKPLPKGRESVAKEMLEYLGKGVPLHPTLELGFNLEAMAVLDAGLRSAESGRHEPVRDPAWA
ncbi:MAG: Gfo/Idh/MocA family oxidoreductase [Oscillospiraceae bacterium]|nr:Gfo/Idh/MocA family oxidoreductase [Oscillospiraceae bacterium]